MARSIAGKGMTLATRSSRRLAVILHADVVGSTGLVQQNETVAHERIRDCFRRFSRLIDSYGGTTRELRGDALVAEFERGSDAVSASLAFQSANESSATDGDHTPRLRVGIALGEVVIADQTVTGAGVILAQRLEQLAAPGAIVLQGAVYETVPRWLPFAYASLGEQSLKGFAESVRAYTVTLEAGRDLPAAEPVDRARRREHRSAGGRHLGEEPGRASPLRVNRRAVAVTLMAGAGTAGLALALSPGLRRGLFGAATKHIGSIAVLPLANLSGDPHQEYFSDGMTESLINELAKVGALKVISRTSVMPFKGTKKPLREIASELSVDAVLEGTAQRDGSRIRITARLIDASTDRSVWEDTYDRNFADVLTLQREVAETVARRIGAELTAQEASRLAPTRAVDPQAHDAYLRGLFSFNESSRPGLDEAEKFFELALQRDPGYALAEAALADVWTSRQQYGFAAPQEAGPKAVEAAERAVALDPSLPEAHYILGLVMGPTLWQWQRADSELARAIELNPSYARARAMYSHTLNILGRPAEARVHIARALELDSRNAFIWGMYAIDLFWFGQYDEALAALNRARTLNPHLPFGSDLVWMVPLAKGMNEEAVKAFVRVATESGDETVAAAARDGLAAGGYKTAFLRAAQATESAHEKGAHSAMDVAVLYAHADRMDLALTWYERAVDDHDPNISYIRFSMIPAKPPENDPRFRSILKRIGLP
jgi:adenylate cyclase